MVMKSWEAAGLLPLSRQNRTTNDNGYGKIMKLVVNGEPHNHRGNRTIASLLDEVGADPKRVAILINDEVISSIKRDVVILSEGDNVEVLTFVGGG